MQKTLIESHLFTRDIHQAKPLSTDSGIATVFPAPATPPWRGASARWVRQGGRRQAGAAEPGAWSVAWVAGFLLLHFALALLMKKVSAVAAGHAVVTLAVGFWFSLRKGPIRVVQWVAYMVGAEVVWRMCHAPIPWEFAKHSIWFIGLVVIVRAGGIRTSWLPAIYFLLLVPASALTFAELPFTPARKQISFSLSGPVCLAICAMLCSTLRLTVADFRRIALICLGPIASAAFIVLFGIATVEVDFTSGSNSALSGGYGPNQVSSMLSLGAVLGVFLYLFEDRSTLLRYGMVGLALWMLAQSALTFSRTGAYLFGAAFALAGFFLVQWKRRSRRFLLLMLLLGAAGGALLPLLNAYTGGTLADRFADKGLTGRDNIAQLDLRVWRDHIFFGAGPGMSMYLRSEDGKAPAAHTEYTRLLADHGLFGLAALAILFVMTWQAFHRAQDPWAKAIVSALSIWAFLFMAGTAMRLAAPAFLLGLIHARFTSDRLASPPAQNSRRPGRGRSAAGARVQPSVGLDNRDETNQPA